jgi:purine-binding chemotaxis protein CheW
MSSDNPDIQLACFSLGGKLFAVDIMRIREILLPQRLSAHPGKPSVPEGVINLRGVLIPVMNLRRRFALEVDTVMGIITVPAREIYAPMDSVDGIGLENLLGLCLSDNRVFMILDIDSLLGQSECREAVCAPTD